MSRLLIHVEGETEETFVNEVLAPHLYSRGYSRVGAPLMGTLAILEIGLAAIRDQCPHFRSWLERLEAAGRPR